MRMVLQRFSHAVAIAAAAVSCVPATENAAASEVEQALTGYQIVTVETAVSTLSSKQLVASCPAGTRVFGAGWAVLDSTGAILEGVATYFEPRSDGSGWLMNARNASSFASSWKLQVRLQCGAAPAGYEIVNVETALATGSFKQLQAACPAGKVTLGAGWSVVDTTRVILDGEAQFFQFNGNDWLINATSNAGATPWKLQSLVICANASAISGYEIVTLDTPVDASGTKWSTAVCPAGKKPTSLGWGVLDPTSAILDGRATFSMAAFDGASWLTFAHNRSSFAPTWKLRTQVVCTL